MWEEINTKNNFNLSPSMYMIRLERTEYGTFLLFNLPFMDQEQGIGYSPMDLEQEDEVKKR